MKIVVTGSLGSISKPLAKELILKGHNVTIISSNTNKTDSIELLGAEPAIGSVEDVEFLTKVFSHVDAVYLMEPPIDIFKSKTDIVTYWTSIANNYVQAILNTGVQKAVHLSSVGAHTDRENASLAVHYKVEQILRGLPETVSIKFMRPVSFYTNTYRFLNSIKKQQVLFGTYSGEQKEPWVSPLDIASSIAEELSEPFNGRKVRYIASEELSLNEIAAIIGNVINIPDLKYVHITKEQMLSELLEMGVKGDLAERFMQMQVLQGTGVLYEDYYKNPPKKLGKIKFQEFVDEFKTTYFTQR